MQVVDGGERGPSEKANTLTADVKQSAGNVSIGTAAHLEGMVLADTPVAIKTGASVIGRLLAQTAITLQKNTLTQPVP